MHRFTAVRTVLLAAAFCAAALAQSSNGYVFFAPGGVTSGGATEMTLHLGAGGEGILGKGVGVGAEIGALGPRQEFSAAVGIFSPNGYYHLLRRSGRKLDPFVTGGYTLLFRSGSANLFNFGGGVNYWFHNHLGIRVEFRDHVWTSSGYTDHYWGVRTALAFR
jgi:hypothetical protein